MAIKRKVPKKGEPITCVGNCGRTLARNTTNFFKSNKEEDKELHDGFCPMCKKCLKKALVDDYGKTSKTQFKTILKLLDVVFVPKLFNEALLVCYEDQSGILGEYRRALALTGAYSGDRYEESAKYEYQEMLGSKEEIAKVSEEMLEFWGTDIKDPKLYHLYQKEFDMLCLQDGGEINSVKESYFKNIAILTHKSQQQLLQEQYKDYDMTIKTLTTICEKCGINPKQVQDKDDSNRGTYGVFIKMIEEEEPIEDWNKMMGSLDMVKRVLEVFFFGHLAEVMGFKNPLKCKYDEVLGEYSVSTETWEDLANIEEEEEEEPKGFRRLLKARKVNGKWKRKNGGD